jgi:hypothetical protein
MGTLLRFALHGAGSHAYRAAYDVLAPLGFEAVDGAWFGGALCAGCPLPAAVVARVAGDPAALSRAAFVALAEAKLHPVAVTGRVLDAPGATA